MPNDYFVYEVYDHGSRVIVPRPRWPSRYFRFIPIHVMKEPFTDIFSHSLKTTHTVVPKTLYQASDNHGSFSTVVRSVTSIKVSCPGTKCIYFDHWKMGMKAISHTTRTSPTSRIWGDDPVKRRCTRIQRMFCRAGASIVLEKL